MIEEKEKLVWKIERRISLLNWDVCFYQKRCDELENQNERLGTNWVMHDTMLGCAKDELKFLNGILKGLKDV